MKSPRRVPRSVSTSILLGLALVVSACGGPGSGGDADGRQAAAQFLEEIRAGRVAPAWQGTTAEFKSFRGLENLGQYVKSHPALTGKAELVESRASGRGLFEHVFRCMTQIKGKEVRSTVKVLVAPNDRAWGVEALTVE
ncbi:MAG: hypothetical protein U0835_08800 [Isosphaeraceae bacterium]